MTERVSESTTTVAASRASSLDRPRVSLSRLRQRLVAKSNARIPNHTGGAGAKRVHVHLVDVDTKELIAAWLLTAAAEPRPLFLCISLVSISIRTIERSKDGAQVTWLSRTLSIV